MAKLIELTKDVRAVQKPAITQSLRKVMESGQRRLESFDKRREADFKRVAEIKQRF